LRLVDVVAGGLGRKIEVVIRVKVDAPESG
jgi:hypothetical protein